MGKYPDIFGGREFIALNHLLASLPTSHPPFQISSVSLLNQSSTRAPNQPLGLGGRQARLPRLPARLPLKSSPNQVYTRSRNRSKWWESRSRHWYLSPLQRMP